MKVKTKKDRRTRVRLRQRQRIRGTAERPRLAVSRSLVHISAQVIDDQEGRTLVSASSMESAVKAMFQDGAKGSNRDGAHVVGTVVAERLLKHGVKKEKKHGITVINDGKTPPPKRDDEKVKDNF